MTWLTRNVRVLSEVSFLQDAASELLYPLLPIYLTTVLGAPPAVVGAIEGVAEGAASVTKVAVGPLGDRFAKRPLIATGYGMAALGKVIVAVDPRYFRPAEVETLLGDPTKAQTKLGWTPKVTFKELVAEMVREDLKSAERDELVKRHGYAAYDYNE